MDRVKIVVLVCLCMLVVGCEMSDKPIAYKGKDGERVAVGVGDTLRVTLTGDLVEITGRPNFLSIWWHVKDIKTGRTFSVRHEDTELP